MLLGSGGAHRSESALNARRRRLLIPIESTGVRLGVNRWVRVPDVVVAEAELYQMLAERFRAAGIGVPRWRHEVRVLDRTAITAP